MPFAQDITVFKYFILSLHAYERDSILSTGINRHSLKSNVNHNCYKHRIVQAKYVWCKNKFLTKRSYLK